MLQINNLYDVIADKAEKLIADAATYGAQLVVFPEAFIGGYPRGSTFGVTIGSRSAKGKEDFRRYHAAAIDVPGTSILYCSINLACAVPSCVLKVCNTIISITAVCLSFCHLKFIFCFRIYFE